MFRSRKSSQSNAAARSTPATPAAATAAAQAFLANRASNANLSSAAAAAALRTHATSPAPVSEVQTKRMQRRGSVSSNGSAAGGPGTLRRQGSSGSMTERTFREQSPSRPSSSRVEEPPPLPALPKNYVKQNAKKKLVRRPSSAEPPQRIMSPVPDAQGGRGVSLDRSGSIPKSDPPPLPSTPRLAKIDTNDGAQKGANRASVNFSRPMSPQLSSPSSPTSSPRPPTQPKTRNQRRDDIISPSDVQNIDHSLQNAATAPVKKKKKKTAPPVTEGSHLSVGHSAGKLSGTAIGADTTNQKTTAKLNTADELPETTDGTISRSSPAPQPDDGSDVDTSDGGSKVNSARATGKLTKQPSIVREDREGEELEERKAQVEAPTAAKVDEQRDEPVEEPRKVEEQQQLPNGTASAIFPDAESEPSQHVNGDVAKGESQTTPLHLGLQPEELPKTQKRLSLSPSRSAHFSKQLVTDTPGLIKHEPPARAASPAKSALKRSPSPRHPSPSGLALSEVSDTMSLGSEDGIRPEKKKKNVRVSFDDEPLVVGEAADPQSNTNSPVIFSPQNRDPSKRPLFTFNRDKLREAPQDDIISPIPKLPSFGSVRSRKEQQADNDTPSKLFSGEEHGHTIHQGLMPSSDHAVGAIVAQDAASKANDHFPRDPNEPLPPEVTTVEGSGYHSDSESSDNGANGDIAVKSTEFPEEPALKAVEAQAREAQDVPTIAVQPATPGQEHTQGDRESWLANMPGSFPVAEITLPESESARPSTTQVESIKVDNSEPSTLELGTQNPAEAERPQAIKEQSSTERDESDDESNGSGDSIYSDAAEDVADLEGDGFGSINAIVDSPVIIPSTQALKTIEPPSPETSPSKAGTKAPDGKTWESTKNFWSGVKQSTKSGTNDQRTKLPSTVAPSLSSNRTQNGQPKESSDIDSTVQRREASEQISPPPKSKLRDIPEVGQMRKSMRSPRPSSQVESAVPLRYPMIEKSRQSNEPLQLAKTLRQAPKAQAPQPNQPASASRDATKKRLSSKVPTPTMRQETQTAANKNPGASVKPTPSSLGGQPGQSTKKPSKLPMLLANDSDSDSSFKRARRRPTNDSGRYTMRRSMRAAAPEGRPQSASFSSSSTTGGPPPRNTMRQRPMSATSMSMRTSLRDSGFEAQTAPQTRHFGFGKGSKNTNKSKSKPRKLSNSSDEDDGPRTFKSRFADSSDEDEPAAPKLPLGLAPVRGIPRRIDEGDSTDLEDSDDETKKRPKPALSSPPPPVSLNGAAKIEGSALASGSLRNKPEEPKQTRFSTLASFRNAEPERKRSLFGALGRKKDKSKFKPDIESAARRDTPLERTKFERTVTGQTPESPTDTAVNRPMSPTPRAKLQRRVTPQRVFSDSWPLPPPIPESPASALSDQRPATSDGAASRPSVGQRRISTNTNQGDGVAVGRTGKKKRFPMLRKAFGLHD